MTHADRCPLTGLPGRASLMAALGAAPPCQLTLVGLDRFASVSARLGDAAADGVLATVATRLHGVAPAPRVLVRLGGDTFAAVHDTVDDSVRWARAAQTAACEPMTVDAQTVAVGATAGVAAWGFSAAATLAAGEEALRAAKGAGRGSLVVGATVDVDDDTIALAAEVHGAVARGEVELFFQPEVDLGSGRVVTVEALVRWRHPSRGLLGAATLLDAAERAGQGPTLDRFVLEAACRQLAGWASHPTLATARVAVNLSGRQLRAGLASLVLDVADAAGADPARLQVEVTETSQLDEVAVAELFLLRAAGVTIALDDFGTGWSTLHRLRTLPADVVKADRALVADIAEDRAARAVLAATVSVAHALGMRVVVEGIEDAQQAEVVAELGADIGQGFHLGRPVPPSQLDEGRPAA